MAIRYPKRLVVGERLSINPSGRRTSRLLKLECGHSKWIPGSRRVPKLTECEKCYWERQKPK